MITERHGAMSSLDWIAFIPRVAEFELFAGEVRKKPPPVQPANGAMVSASMSRSNVEIQDHPRNP
jgi:hypothetical protein